MAVAFGEDEPAVFDYGHLGASDVLLRRGIDERGLTRPELAVVLSMSKLSLQDAIERANQANILFIAAAGNSSANNDTTANYPSNYPNANVIAFAAITSTGALASFSNYGANKVHLGAPGASIVSTVPGRKGLPAYASYSGTSMATPHVTGAAAMYASTHPGATAAQIKDAILRSAAPTPSLAGKTITGGRLNVSAF